MIDKTRQDKDSILYQYTIPKTSQLVLKPKPEWEIEIKAFRELHTRNQLSISRTLMEKAVRPFLKEHHWPPGNSQTLLLPNQGRHPLCKCGRKATRKVTTRKNEIVFCCSLHMPKDVERWKEVSKG